MDLMSSSEAVAKAKALTAELIQVVVSNDIIRAAQIMRVILTEKLHMALGYHSINDYWGNVCPGRTIKMRIELANAGRALLVVPELAEAFRAGTLNLKDLDEAGRAANSCHEVADVKRIAFDKTFRRAMLIRAVSRGAITHLATHRAGPRRTFQVAAEIIDGAWRTYVLSAYRKAMAATGKTSVQQRARPSFEMLLAWLILDWQRLRKDEKNRATEAERTIHVQPE